MLAWLGVLALVVFTVIGVGSYTSMLPADIKGAAVEDATSDKSANVATDSAEAEAIDAADSEATE